MNTNRKRNSQQVSTAALSRRDFIRMAGVAAVATGLSRGIPALAAPQGKPNFIFVMTDDHGCGLTGYNGHSILKTPCLDDMAANSLRFDRFHSTYAICSPTRASILTGRHPCRYGVVHASTQFGSHWLNQQELTLARVMKASGYTTGHFGKWHVSPVNIKSGPGEYGFDEWFSTENNRSTHDPSVYFTKSGKAEVETADDSCKVIMDRALDFSKKAAAAHTPFLALVWLHTPHWPIRTPERFQKLYADQPPKLQEYFGDLSAMDEQVGRLRQELKKMGAAENTLLWFCGDNGEDGSRPGSKTTLRGSKATIYEGGTRVPGLLEWPGVIAKGRSTSMPCSTLDFYPTLLDIIEAKPTKQPEPLDGISLLPLVEGRAVNRPKPIPFALIRSDEWRKTKNHIFDYALLDGDIKFYSSLQDGDEKNDLLFDLSVNPTEIMNQNLVSEKKEAALKMKTELKAWRASVDNSLAGKDYSG